MLFKKGQSSLNKGKKASKETKKKLSESHKGQIPWNKGIPCREETKIKLRLKNTGKEKTAETKQKLSDSLKGRVSPMKGRKQTEEAKNKISKANKNKKKPPFTEEHKRNISISRKGKMTGDSHPSKRPEVALKISLGRTGKCCGINNPMKRPEVKAKISGENSHRWRGGYYMQIQRQNSKRRNMGFVPIYNIIKEGDYEWHHIIKGKPYVVQCPTHIHKMFRGGGEGHILHFHNVNAFLGIIDVEDPEIPIFKHTSLEGDIQ